LLGVIFLDPQNDLFAIAKSIKGEDYLHIAKLEGQQLIDTGWSVKIGKTEKISSDVPLHHIWLVHGNKLFAHDRELKRMLCVDGGGQPVPHPFSKIYNRESSRFARIEGFVIHPSLPFGVLVEDQESGPLVNRLAIIRWDSEDADGQAAAYGKCFEPLAALFGLEKMEFAYQSFSPCGKWHVAGCISPEDPQSPHFIAMRVDAEHPDLLDRGDIIILGQVKNVTSIAWASEPSSYVVSNGELLHKWDLEELPNAKVFAMPGEGGGGKKSLLGRLAVALGRKK
jgi:hypothetical protein